MNNLREKISIGVMGLAITLASTLHLNAQELPKEKDAKAYFKKLQTERVESSSLVEWHQFGPGTSGYCESIWIHPTDPKTMIMSPDMHNTYGTWDGGESWTTVKDVDDNKVVFNRVMCLAFSPTKPNFGLAVIPQGNIMRSDDKGHSWQLTNAKVGQCSAIAVDPTNANRWYAGPGRFWDVKGTHRTAKSLENPGYNIRKKNDGSIYLSTDAGKTWVKSNVGLPANIEVGRIIVNPTKTKEIILASNYGIFKSTNYGKSWKESYKGIPIQIIRDLDMHFDKKSNEVTLFALDQTAYFPENKSIRSEGGVYRSDDFGASWQSITGDLAIDMTKITGQNLTWLFTKTMNLWFGTKGPEFRKMAPELPKNILSVYNRLRVNPLNKNEIYISGNHNHDMGFAPGDVWKTEDGGKHWFTAARSSKYWIDGRDGEYWESRNNPKGMNTTFAHMNSFIRNKDAETWGNRMMEMGLDGTLYTCFEQQFMRTTDGGKSWEQYDDIETSPGSGYWIGRGASNLPGRYILLETGIKDRILLCSGEHGLWQTNSREGAMGGDKIAVKQIEGQCNDVHHHGAHSIASVAVDPKDPNIIYTIQFRQTHRGFFRRSMDGGKTWENISEPLPWNVGNPSSDHIFQYSLMVDPVKTKNIYFCAIEHDIADVAGSDLDRSKYPDFGVHRSKDGGFTWEKANNGLPEKCSVRRLTMDPDKSNVIYAALNDALNGNPGGLYKSTNGCDSWKKMNIPSQIKSVNNVFIDRNNRYIYISCGANKGTLDDSGVWRSKDEGKSWEKIFFMRYIWQCETSPVDPNIITVVAAGTSGSMNPGAYVSLDGGKSWNKVNQNMGQPNTIVDFKPDTYDKNKFWAAVKGSGWSVGYIK